MTAWAQEVTYFKYSWGQDTKFTKVSDTEWSFMVTGGDPIFVTQALGRVLEDDEDCIEFDYICPSGISTCQFFFSPIATGREMNFKLEPATDWTNKQINIAGERLKFNWGYSANDYIRMDRVGQKVQRFRFATSVLPNTRRQRWR